MSVGPLPRGKRGGPETMRPSLQSLWCEHRQRAAWDSCGPLRLHMAHPCVPRHGLNCVPQNPWVEVLRLSRSGWDSIWRWGLERVGEASTRL